MIKTLMAYDSEHEENGFLLNVVLNQVLQIIQEIRLEYCDRKAYPRDVVYIVCDVANVPVGQVQLMDQPKSGAVLNYNYSRVEPNTSNNSDCIYKFFNKELWKKD